MEITASSLLADFAVYTVFYGIGIFIAYFLGLKCC